MRVIGATSVLILLLALIGVRETFYVVDETNQAIVTQVGQFLRTDAQPGLYAKIPFYHTVTYFDKRILVTETPQAEYLTLDKKRIVIDPITRWRIVDPFQFYISVRDEAGARAQLDDIVLSTMREEIAQTNFIDVVDKKREVIEEATSRRAFERSKDFGLQVIDVRSRRTDLPPEVQASVFARMVAERAQVSHRYRSEGAEESAKVRAEADKERTIILAGAYEQAQKLNGEGDALAAGIYANAFGQDPEFYSLVRSLEAYEKFVNPGTTLVLSSDSELMRFLGGAKGATSTPTAGR